MTHFSELEGSDWIHCNVRRFGLEVPATIVAGLTLGPPALAAAAGLAINFRKMPLFSQDREGTLHYKLETIPPKAILAAAEILTQGTWDDRTSRYANLVRRSSLDEVPQLAAVLRRDDQKEKAILKAKLLEQAPTNKKRMTLWGVRAVLPVDHEKFRKANPSLYEELCDTKATTKVRPAITGPSSAFRKTIKNPLSPQANTMSTLLDLQHMNKETAVTEIRGYFRLLAIMAGVSHWPISSELWDKFEDKTDMQRDAAAKFFGIPVVSKPLSDDTLGLWSPPASVAAFE